jgi:hypothetical protein
MNFSLKAPARLGLSSAFCVSAVFGLRGTLCTRAALPQYGGDIVMETDHEKAQYAWDYRWSRVVDCDALLASMVAKECGAVA